MDSYVAYGVVAHLQRMVADLPPGSERAEVAEYGVSLALSPARPAKTGPLLLHDIWRNASHNYYRGARRRRALVDRLAAYGPTGGVPGTSAPGGYPGDDPAAIVEAADLEANLRAGARTIPYGARCLDGLLLGETATETATAAGISVRTVLRTRERRRASTRQLIAEAPAQPAGEPGNAQYFIRSAITPRTPPRGSGASP
jgi:hypothetical protein